MFIKNIGLFWLADEVHWNPGSGARRSFRLLGRQGKNLPGLRLADFRHQQGIYILYSNHGPYYVGLTKKQGLGKRLKDHLWDDHEGMWNRFSWFGFCAVLNRQDDYGLHELRGMAEATIANPSEFVTDVEALLIRAMGLRNINETNFTNDEEWKQVKAHEVERCMKKIE